MPLLPAFEKEMTDSKIADTRNLGAGRWGGANTAAAFLKQFVPNRGEGDDAEQITWAHMDIAGTYWGAKTNKMVGHGATGIHVRTMKSASSPASKTNIARFGAFGLIPGPLLDYPVAWQR